ncbi:SMI1/KNR4 family protein [Streptomyces sp. HB2AG]|uniref:SMI1/KNR4 family protein n=1 Tax=Streptomyces sp. HB2AG TaxID=2983400 RepID=UPI0022AA6B20|nr:SMI1/KNR4 family protein [Streptomyces sp. HB2AG]MCZ2525798.1 SMI1/KNR4 family protein [Streptomyces sp. HB2AG]
METDWSGVRERVLEAYGARTGRGRSRDAPRPPLTESQVREAEEQFGIAFPSDYRRFLLRVGAGGFLVHALHRGPDGWAWEGDPSTDRTRLATPFPDPASHRALTEELDLRWNDTEVEPHLLDALARRGCVVLR